MHASGWASPNTSIALYLKPKFHNETTIGHLRFYVGVLKKSIPSCGKGAKYSNHELEGKTRTLQSCSRPKRVKTVASRPKAIKTKKRWGPFRTFCLPGTSCL